VASSSVQHPPVASGSLVRLALVFYGALAGAAWLWAWLAGRPLWFASAEAQQLGMHWVRDAALGIGAGLAVVVASRVMMRVSAAARALADHLAALLGRPSTPVCLVLAAVSGFAEEAFFRAALQPAIGLVAASVVFALAHFVPRRDYLAWPVFAFAAGLAFGALFDGTGALLAPVLAHFSVNAVNLRWLASRADAPSASPAASA
jgi:membrane protease YdiL (CAAX protease family)